jgi:peptidoglycan hydrolase-like protein with peptidoglycan-binding domain
VNILPQEIRRMSRKQKLVTLALGAGATGALLLLFDRFARSSPLAPAHRYAVSGTWTDMASKLGISIGRNLDIKTAQRYLNDIASAALTENGVLDAATSDALRKFQTSNGIDATGVIDDETGNALQYFAAATSQSPSLLAAVTLPDATTTTTTATVLGPWAQAVARYPQMGAPFSSVVKMSAEGAKRALNDIMHLGLQLGGGLDAAAQQALKTFQANTSLPVTGLLDPETSNALLYLATVATTATTPARQAPVASRLAATRRGAASPRSPTPPPLTAAVQARLASAPRGAVVDIGHGWVMIGNCACPSGDQACIASCGGHPTAAAGHVTGIQSTTMYDPQNYYGDPKPYWPATNPIDDLVEPRDGN